MKKLSIGFIIVFCFTLSTSLAIAQDFPPTWVQGPFPTGTEPARGDAPCDETIPDEMGTIHEYTAYRGTPTVDGNVDDDPVWNQIPWTAMNKYTVAGGESCFLFDDACGDVDNYLGPEDITAWFKILWDDDHIYFALKKIDNEYVFNEDHMGDNQGNIWQDDAYQIIINANDPFDREGPLPGAEVGVALLDYSEAAYQNTWDNKNDALLELAEGGSASAVLSGDGKAFFGSHEDHAETGGYIEVMEFAFVKWDDIEADIPSMFSIMANDPDEDHSVDALEWSQGIFNGKLQERYASIVYSSAEPPGGGNGGDGELPEPVMFLDFEETEGVVCIDQGTAKNNGSIEGPMIERVNEGIVKREGETGRAIEFIDETSNGEWDLVRVPFIDAFNSPNYTISIWGMYTREEPTWGYMFWADGEYWPQDVEDRHIDVWLNPGLGSNGGGIDCILHLLDEGTLRTQTNSDELGYGPMDGDWHQFTIVLEDNIVQKVYIDGELAAEAEGTDEVVDNGGDDMWIGGRPNDADGLSSIKWVGLFDNFRYWDVALTEEQIVYLANMEGPNGGSVGVADKVETPAEFALAANYPNPFNPTTTISFSLDKTQDVSVDVYDLLGHKIKTLVSGVQTAGVHTLQWDATDESGQRVSSGVYLYRLNAGDRVETRKMMLLK